MKKYIL